MKKKAIIIFLLLGAISMLVMSSHYLLSDTSGILKRKEIATELWYLIVFRMHVTFGLVAMLVGPFQLIKKIRTSRIEIHKALGYLYVVSVFLSGLSGLIVAQFAMGGLLTTVGFTILGLAWLYSTTRSIVAIRNAKLPDHKKWSYYSYALTFSAITQRSLLLIPLLTDIPFMPIYQLSAWLPWMLNISIVYYVLKPNSKVQLQL
jgi:uncharacterized membrane protein